MLLDSGIHELCKIDGFFKQPTIAITKESKINRDRTDLLNFWSILYFKYKINFQGLFLKSAIGNAGPGSIFRSGATSECIMTLEILYFDFSNTIICFKLFNCVTG